MMSLVFNIHGKRYREVTKELNSYFVNGSEVNVLPASENCAIKIEGAADDNLTPRELVREVVEAWDDDERIDPNANGFLIGDISRIEVYRGLLESGNYHYLHDEYHANIIFLKYSKKDSKTL